MSTQEAFRLVGVVEARTRSAEADLHRFDRTAQNSARNLRTSLGSIDREFSGAGRGVSSFLERFSHISNVIQGIPQIGALAGAITRPLFQATQEGIRLNMVLEQAEIGYEKVAGGQENARKFLRDLQEFGKRSPFRFEGLLEASRFMNAMGFELDEQIPKLRVWGNTIAASGEISADKVRDVVRAMGQMRMNGRVNAQDMNQLINANIPAWELLAKAIGKTVAETRKLSEAGRLDGGKAVEAMTAMMEIDPRYENMMARLEKTGAGRLSAAEDMIQFAQAKATKGLTQNISDTIDAALKREDLVDSLAGTFESAITPVSSILSAAAKDLLGGGITGGIKEGIAAGREAVALEAASLGQGIIDSFKSILGINSPSRVFMEFGRDVADGFNIGFAEGMRGGSFQSSVDGFLSGVKDKTQREKIERSLSENATRTGIPLELLRALVHQESRGHYNALSPKGARGIMQLMPATARGQGLRVDKKVDERLDLEKSIRAGADYLKQQLDRFNGDVRLALAAYNAGPGAVQKYGNQIPPYAETQNYVRTIMAAVAQAVPNVGADVGFGAGLSRKAPSADEYRRVMAALTPAEKTQVEELGATIKQTMDRLAQINAQLRGAQTELDRARPAANNGRFDPNREYSASFAVDNLKDQQSRLLISLQQLNEENKKLIQSLLARYGEPRKDSSGPQVGADVGYKAAAVLRQTAEVLEPAAQRLRVVNKELRAVATEPLPQVAQATAQIADNTERIVKGAGEWKDVIVQSEESIRRLKVHWSGIAGSFEDAFLSATGQALQGNFGDAIRGFFLDLSFDIAQQFNSALSARISKSLFDFDGETATGGLVGKLLNKVGLGSILEKAGLQAPRQMTFEAFLDKRSKQPLTTSSVMATTLGAGTGGGVDRAARGSMPASKGNPPRTTSSVDTGPLRQAVQTSTDKIVSGQQAQTAQLTTAMSQNTDRLVEALTPTQPGFWSGLASAALGGAASGAAGGLVGGLFEGGGNVADEGPAQPRPTTPPVLQFPNGRTTPRRATGGIIDGPGTETSDSILGVDRRGVPTALVSKGEFVVNAAATRKNRTALELINKSGRLPRLGWGGFLSLTSPISHKSVRNVTMPISHEGFRNVTMPFASPQGRRAISPYLSGLPAPQPAGAPQTNSANRKVENHYHFKMNVHANDAQSIKRSRFQIERQFASSLRNASARAA